MNWLIIAQDVQDKDVRSVEDFLAAKGVEPTEALLFKNMTSEDLEDVVSKCIQVTHCIILGSAELSELSEYGFLLGALMGHSVETLLSERGQYTSRFELKFPSPEPRLNHFENTGKLLSHLENNFEEISRIDVVHQSLVTLITRGIPFTSDSFARAISKDDEELCDLFINAGMEVDARTSEGVPMMCVATRSDCVSRVKWLLEKGADINAISYDRGYSPVMDAVWRKNPELTEFLVDNGADLSFVSSDGQPILVLAVGNGNLRIVELLLKHGADADKQDGMGMSARAYANLFKKPGMVELFEKFPKKEAL